MVDHMIPYLILPFIMSEFLEGICMIFADDVKLLYETGGAKGLFADLEFPLSCTSALTHVNANIYMGRY